MTEAELNEWVQNEIQGAEAFSRDLTGNGDHFELTVIHPDFEGKSILQCQRKVMDALAPLFQGPLHAATVKTYPRRPQ